MLLKTDLSLSSVSRQILPSFRVAIVSDAIAERNGVGTYYRDLTEHLRDLGIGVEMICPGADRDPAFEAFRIPLPGDSTQALAFPKWGRLRATLTEFRPHIVLIPTLGPYSLLGAREGARLNIPVVVGHHTDFEKLAKLYWHPLFSSTGSRILRTLHRQLLRYADAVIANSEDSVRDARQLRGRRVFLVGTPLAKGFFMDVDVRDPGAVRRVLFVGRLAREKNVDQLVAAARQLPNVQFRIVGDGPLRSSLKHQAHGLTNVDFTGWLNRQQVLGEIDACDLLVLPSSIETFGTVALEGLARHRAVLISRNCGIHDWPDLAQGLMTTLPDESLDQAIRRISAMDPAVRRQIIDRGWTAAREWNEVALGGWLQILLGLVDSSLALPQPLTVG